MALVITGRVLAMHPADPLLRYAAARVSAIRARRPARLWHRSRRDAELRQHPLLDRYPEPEEEKGTENVHGLPAFVARRFAE